MGWEKEGTSQGNRCTRPNAFPKLDSWASPVPLEVTMSPIAECECRKGQGSRPSPLGSHPILQQRKDPALSSHPPAPAGKAPSPNSPWDAHLHFLLNPFSLCMAQFSLTPSPCSGKGL